LLERIPVVQRQSRGVFSEIDLEGGPCKCGGKNECQ
jgi:hypothetical protein